MQVTVFAPSAVLAPFVERFTIIETGASAAMRVLLPAPGLMLGLRFAGASSLVDGTALTRVPDAAITGVLRSARHMHTAAHSGVIVAQFRPGGAAACFAEPLHELFGATVGLDALVPRATLARLGPRLAGAADHAQRVALVEQFLRARLAPERADPLALAAVDAIRRVAGQLRIRDLARGLGISQDPLEKRFRRAVGASPKHWASLIRMSHVIDGTARPFGGAAARGQAPVVDGTARPFGGAAARGQAPVVDGTAPPFGGAAARGQAPVVDGSSPPTGGVDWARRAIAAGYYDQSHFIRAFRAVTGAPPDRFFRAGNHC